MVMRRMSLVGDALSHVALPGIALSLLWHINPFIGAFIALAVGILLIWAIELRTGLNTDALVGLLFTSALAIGLLITPHEEILDALIGDISTVTAFDTVIAVILSIIIYLVMRKLERGLILSSLSPDLAISNGINTSRTNLIFLFMVALIVALGIKVVGTLLMGALVIIPAIAARNLTRSMSGYINASLLIGGISGVTGILLARTLDFPAGPLVVLVSACVFIISLAFPSRA